MGDFERCIFFKLILYIEWVIMDVVSFNHCPSFHVGFTSSHVVSSNTNCPYGFVSSSSFMNTLPLSCDFLGFIQELWARHKGMVVCAL